MNPRCLITALATLTGFGISAPAVAQSKDDAQAAPDARTSKAKDLASDWQLKPRWRMQYDVASIDGPDGLAGVGNFQDILGNPLKYFEIF